MTKNERRLERRLKRIERKLDDLLDLAWGGDEVYELTEEGRRVADLQSERESRRRAKGARP